MCRFRQNDKNYCKGEQLLFQQNGRWHPLFFSLKWGSLTWSNTVHESYLTRKKLTYGWLKSNQRVNAEIHWAEYKHLLFFKRMWSIYHILCPTYGLYIKMGSAETESCFRLLCFDAGSWSVPGDLRGLDASSHMMAAQTFSFVLSSFLSVFLQLLHTASHPLSLTTLAFMLRLLSQDVDDSLSMFPTWSWYLVFPVCLCLLLHPPRLSLLRFWVHSYQVLHRTNFSPWLPTFLNIFYLKFSSDVISSWHNVQNGWCKAKCPPACKLVGNDTCFVYLKW